MAPDIKTEVLLNSSIQKKTVPIDVRQLVMPFCSDNNNRSDKPHSTHFLDNSTIIAAVKKWVAYSGKDFYLHSM